MDNLSNISVIKDVLARHNFTFSKALGQNFLVNPSVMETDLHKLIAEEFQGMDVAVCANLPYYITSPILMMLLEERLPIKSVTVMVQKEAGTRLCAPMGTRDMGAVTVAINYFSVPKLLFNVSRGSFMPSPNVDSCVVRFDIRDKTPEGVTDEKFFFKVARGPSQIPYHHQWA